MTLHEIVKKLVGPINPVGETHADNDSFENLKIMTQLVDALVTDIDDVAMGNNSHMYSIKRAGELARKFLTWELKRTNNEAERI